MRQTLAFGGHHLYDRLVARRLLRFYQRIAPRRPDSKRILDVGCGPGHLTAALAEAHPDAEVMGLDLDPVQVRLARRHVAPNLRYDVGDSRDLPAKDEAFDWILAAETFHHWHHPEQGLREAYRCLKPGGEFWILEGAGDMTAAELHAWAGKRPWPGLIVWVRLIFSRHGYTTRRLERKLLPLLQASPFSEVEVIRDDGWWILRMRREG